MINHCKEIISKTDEIKSSVWNDKLRCWGMEILRNLINNVGYETESSGIVKLMNEIEEI